MEQLIKVISEKFRTNIKRRDNMPMLLRRGTRLLFGEIFKETGLNLGAEIGTQYGRFAITLIENNPDMRLYCVDPYAPYGGITQERQDRIYNFMLRRLGPYFEKQIFMVKKPSIDAVKEFKNGQLDFVYIDGNHTFDYVMFDLLYWQHKVRRGGIIALHDYRPGRWAGVVEAVDAYTKTHAIHPWFVTREEEPTAFWIKP